MGGATFGRIHVWSDDEDVYASDLNAEFNNILQNLNPAGLDGHEDNATQMRLQTSPGSFGAEVLATSLATEIEQLRFQINAIISGPDNVWYDPPANSLSGLNSVVATANSIPTNRIVSGRVRSLTDNFPVFLQVGLGTGSAASVTLKGATTPFKYIINSTPYTISTDVTLSSLPLAPATQNTALAVEDSLVAAYFTKYSGERDSPGLSLGMSSAGSNITAQIGNFAAFAGSFNSTTEYFVANVESSSKLDRGMRGCGFDHTDAPVVRQPFSNGDTITLCRLNWIYATTVGTLTAVSTNPVYAADQPGSPSIGDYWFDMTNQTWKTYNGAIYVVANATLIGFVICNTTAAKVSRCLEAFANYQATNTIEFQAEGSDTMLSLRHQDKISVAGTTYTWTDQILSWSTALNMAPGLTVAASTNYYLYVSELGNVYIDKERPYDRTGDLLGKYHPYHLWRAVGSLVQTDGSANLVNYSPVRAGLAVGLDELGVSTAAAPASTGLATPLEVGFFSIATTGNPVAVSAQWDGSSNKGFFSLFVNGEIRTALITAFRDSTQVASYQISPSGDVDLPSSAFSFIDYACPAGKHRYTFFIALSSDTGTSSTISMHGTIFLGRELK